MPKNTKIADVITYEKVELQIFQIWDTNEPR